METLSPRRLAFVREYLVDRNATQAYIRAGYSPNAANVNAARLIATDSIASAIAEAEHEAAHRNDLSVDWVLNSLRENVERAMAAHPVMDGRGEPTGEYRYDGAVANKALELLGKHIGMWPARPLIEANDNRVQYLNLEHLSMDELRDLAAMVE